MSNFVSLFFELDLTDYLNFIALPIFLSFFARYIFEKTQYIVFKSLNQKYSFILDDEKRNEVDCSLVIQLCWSVLFLF